MTAFFDLRSLMHIRSSLPLSVTAFHRPQRLFSIIDSRYLTKDCPQRSNRSIHYCYRVRPTFPFCVNFVFRAVIFI
ncbi:hypothetical protein L6452_26209 [Arctium lappa]|uniref:Uncharacterized protein n=1 Tax=Arctium lappa TaxID=4217 RepID=A0ACB9AE00_ARCLA|nr:hypothetical protein L6452_26209 [Arctium lappa]